MSLIELQRDLHDWLVREDRWSARRLGDDAAPGLRVYLNNYRAQLVACLDDSFARTRDWIGEAAFRQSVIAHVERVPPSSWTLDAYGRDFPATLALRYPSDPEVAELAAIELALADAFVGPDATALTVDQVAGVDWDCAVLRFAPTLDFVELTTNASAIWSALAAGDMPPAPEMLAETGAVLVWRHDHVAQFRAIDRIEQQAIAAMRSGTSFAELCAQLVESFGEQQGVARGGALLGQWLAEGLIVDIVARA